MENLKNFKDEFTYDWCMRLVYDKIKYFSVLISESNIKVDWYIWYAYLILLISRNI